MHNISRQNCFYLQCRVSVLDSCCYASFQILSICLSARLSVYLFVCLVVRFLYLVDLCFLICQSLRSYRQFVLVALKKSFSSPHSFCHLNEILPAWEHIIVFLFLRQELFPTARDQAVSSINSVQGTVPFFHVHTRVVEN